jgi:peptidoglycan/LPS O-acetylase OafA/YrhL
MTEVTAPKRTALPSLTGMRFIAAGLVFCFHITLANSPIPPFGPVNPVANQQVADTLSWVFSKAGYVGVSFFFVLSGFVLYWSTRPNEPATAFWRRRALKIFPNHLVLFGLAMALFAASITPVRAWLPNIFLLHSFFPQADTYVGVNPPSWTLCCELLFYLLFPLIVVPIRRIAENRLWLWASVMVAGTLAVALLTQYVVPSTPKSPITPVSVTQFWIGYIFPPSRLFEFVFGMVLARMVIAGKAPRIRPLAAACLVVIGYAGALLAPFVYGFEAITVVPIGLIIVAFASADTRGERTWLRGRTAVWLGEISFGFYICQGVIVFYGRRLLGATPFPGPMAALVAAGIFAAAVTSGWLLYTCVERPIMRRWSRKRVPRPTTPPGVLEPSDATGVATP